jgi:hypothetical protein
MPKPLDPVKLAKDISKLTRVPLPKVANVMQKYPLNGPGIKQAFEACKALGADQLDKELKGMFNL